MTFFRFASALLVLTALAGCGSSSDQPDEAPNSTSSDRPDLLGILAGDTTLEVFWLSGGAPGPYRLYIASEPDIEPDAIASYADGDWYDQVTSSFVIDNLDNDKTYYLVVTGRKDGAESPHSRELAATPSATTSQRINPTGSYTCIDAEGVSRACPVAEFPGQDAESDSRAFDFTKLDAHGEVLPDDAESWACVRDNRTGLVWEIKNADGGLHDVDNTYSWRNTDPSNNGGHIGYANRGDCEGSACDTQAFSQAVNATTLCGYSDWRMPHRSELFGLLDFGQQSPVMNQAFFPEPHAQWWTGSALEVSPTLGYAWLLSTHSGAVSEGLKESGYPARLVRGGDEPIASSAETVCGREAATALLATTPTREFTLSDDGFTATHHTTGLMWARCSLGQQWNGEGCDGLRESVEWRDALQAVAAINANEENQALTVYNDWRLPTIKELDSIVEHQCLRNTVNEAIFPDVIVFHQWSSTPIRGPSARAMMYTGESEINEIEPASILRRAGARLVRNID